MKSPAQPLIMVVFIVLAASVNGVGIFFIEEYGDVRCLLAGLGLSLCVSIGIIIDRDRRSVSVFDDETFLLSRNDLLDQAEENQRELS